MPNTSMKGPDGCMYVFPSSAEGYKKFKATKEELRDKEDNVVTTLYDVPERDADLLVIEQNDYQKNTKED